MEMRDALERKPTPQKLAAFGWTVAAGFGVLGGVSWLRHRPTAAVVFAAVGLAMLALARVPRVGPRLYVAWMGLGLALGYVTAPIVMLVVYATVVLPVGLWFKLVGRDTMQRRRDRSRDSYWEEYPRSDDPASYLRQS